jgi:hypothetical protein
MSFDHCHLNVSERHAVEGHKFGSFPKGTPDISDLETIQSCASLTDQVSWDF